eukprot:gene4578-7962_t
MIRAPLSDVSIDQINRESDTNKKKVRLVSTNEHQKEYIVSKTVVFNESEDSKELKRKSTENKFKLEELLKQNKILQDRCNFLENENKLTKNANKLLQQKEENFQKEINDLKQQLDHIITLYKTSREENEIKQDHLEIQIDDSISSESPINQILINNKNEEINALRMSNEILYQQLKEVENTFKSNEEEALDMISDLKQKLKLMEEKNKNN